MREVIDRQVRRRERQRLRRGRHRGRASVWPGSAYIRSRLKVSKAAGRLLHRGDGLRAVVHAADGLQMLVVEALHADRQARHAGGAVGAEAVALEGAGVGLERDLAIGRELQACAQVADQAVDASGRKQAGRTAADEDAVHRCGPRSAAAPHRGRPPGHRGSAAAECHRRRSRHSCELKSQ